MRLSPKAKKKAREAEAVVLRDAEAAAAASAAAPNSTTSATGLGAMHGPTPDSVPKGGKAVRRRGPRVYQRYEPLLAQEICRLIAFGHTVNRICRRPGMPNKNTIYVWAREREDFQKAYVLARQLGRDRMEDDILDIVDDTSRDVIALKDRDGKSREVLNGVAVQRAKVQAGARHLMLARYWPKRIGAEDETGK